MERVVCDFCGFPAAAWRYTAGAVVGAGAPGQPWLFCTDDWLACFGCHELIDAEEWDRLVARAMAGMRARGELRDQAGGADHRRSLKELHEAFGRSRRGAPSPLAGYS